MKLNELRPVKGSRKKRFKIGRGPGSGLGKTGGRGGKGQTARKSGPVGAAFEGGQMPLQRRVPKVGFNSHFPDGPQIVNLGELDLKFAAASTVTAAELKAAGLIRSAEKPVKVLNKGKLTKALNIQASRFSQSAKAAIEAAGGKAEIIAAARGKAK